MQAGSAVFPRPPARDALFDKPIEFAQRPAADPPEVLSSGLRWSFPAIAAGRVAPRELDVTACVVSP